LPADEALDEEEEHPTYTLVGVNVASVVAVAIADEGDEGRLPYERSGALSFYMGIKVHQDSTGTTLRQTAYAKRVLELVGLIDCNPALTPMVRGGNGPFICTKKFKDRAL
jgi:hypothetical protein